MGQVQSCVFSHLDLLPLAALATTCKPAASSSKGASNSTASPLKRTGFARFAQLTSSGKDCYIHSFQHGFFMIVSIQYSLCIACVSTIKYSLTYRGLFFEAIMSFFGCFNNNWNLWICPNLCMMKTEPFDSDPFMPNLYLIILPFNLFTDELI